MNGILCADVYPALPKIMDTAVAVATNQAPAKEHTGYFGDVASGSCAKKLLLKPGPIAPCRS